MNFDFYHSCILQSYCCNLHHILAYLLYSVSNKQYYSNIVLRLQIWATVQYSHVTDVRRIG